MKEVPCTKLSLFAHDYFGAHQNGSAFWGLVRVTRKSRPSLEKNGPNRLLLVLRSLILTQSDLKITMFGHKTEVTMPLRNRPKRSKTARSGHTGYQMKDRNLKIQRDLKPVCLDWAIFETFWAAYRSHCCLTFWHNWVTFRVTGV